MFVWTMKVVWDDAEAAQMREEQLILALLGPLDVRISPHQRVRYGAQWNERACGKFQGFPHALLFFD